MKTKSELLEEAQVNIDKVSMSMNVGMSHVLLQKAFALIALADAVPDIQDSTRPFRDVVQ